MTEKFTRSNPSVIQAKLHLFPSVIQAKLHLFHYHYSIKLNGYLVRYCEEGMQYYR